MHDEWSLAQSDPAEKLARLHHFSIRRPHIPGEREFRITVYEYAELPADRSTRFLARADELTDVGGARYAPCGWGASLVKALQECVREIDRLL